MPIRLVTSETERDFGREAQQAAEAHLARCQEALLAWELGEDEADSPACGPFCGCDTCIVREVLFAAWSVLEAWFEDALQPDFSERRPM